MEGGCTENEDDYEYEESTVLLELQGIIEPDFLKQVKQAKILGIDTEKPFVQLDDYTFTGEYKDSHGTELLFKDVTDESSGGAGEDKVRKLRYECKTNKKLCLQRVFLKNETQSGPKEAVPSTSKASNDGQIPVQPEVNIPDLKEATEQNSQSAVPVDANS